MRHIGPPKALPPPQRQMQWLRAPMPAQRLGQKENRLLDYPLNENGERGEAYFRLSFINKQQVGDGHDLALKSRQEWPDAMVLYDYGAMRNAKRQKTAPGSRFY